MIALGIDYQVTAFFVLWLLAGVVFILAFVRGVPPVHPGRVPRGDRVG